MNLKVGELYFNTVSLFLYPSQDKAEEAAVSGGGIANFYFSKQAAHVLKANETFLILKIGRKVYERTPTLVMAISKKTGWANLLEIKPI